jgi:hypothetical protein
MNKIFIPIIIIFLAVVVYTFSQPQTYPGQYTNDLDDITVQCSSHSDCEPIDDINRFNGCFSGTCQETQIGTCFIPEDCNGQPLAVIQCVGNWECPDNRCNWVCG